MLDFFFFIIFLNFINAKLGKLSKNVGWKSYKKRKRASEEIEIGADGPTSSGTNRKDK